MDVVNTHLLNYDAEFKNDDAAFRLRGRADWPVVRHQSGELREKETRREIDIDG